MIEYLQYATLAASLPIFAYLNRQRGKDSVERFFGIPKILIYVIFASAYWFTLETFQYTNATDILWSAAKFILLVNGFYWLLSPGWGKWFPHADKDTSGERESLSWAVDTLAEFICGYPLKTDTPRDKTIAYKTIGMSLRFTVGGVALIAATAWAAGSFTAGAIMLAGLPVCGIIYRVCFQNDNWKKRTIYAEYLVGAWLSVILLGVFTLCK